MSSSGADDLIDRLALQFVIGFDQFRIRLVGAVDFDHARHFQNRPDVGTLQHSLHYGNVARLLGSLVGDIKAVGLALQTGGVGEGDDLKAGDDALAAGNGAVGRYGDVPSGICAA